jgi:hypothetical protein
VPEFRMSIGESPVCIHLIRLKARSLFVVCLLVSLCGCSMSTTARLYPVEGPLLQQSPLPALVATAHDVQRNNGEMTLAGHDGELFTGEWSSLAGVSVSTLALFNQYEATYGVVRSRGSKWNPGPAFLVGNRGTTIDIEFVTAAGTVNGFGYAKDNRGNVYRLLF